MDYGVLKKMYWLCKKQKTKTMFSLVLLVWTETNPGLTVMVAALSVSTSEKHEWCYILCRYIFHRISGNWCDHILKIHTSWLYITYLTCSGRGNKHRSKRKKSDGVKSQRITGLLLVSCVKPVFNHPLMSRRRGNLFVATAVYYKNRSIAK